MKCVCDVQLTKGNTAHYRTCSQYKNEVVRIEELVPMYINELYSQSLSVSECTEKILSLAGSELPIGKARKIVDTYVKTHNMFRGLADPILNMRRQQKVKNTMIERYGVENWGQTAAGGYRSLNKIPYSKLECMEQYNEFRKKVERGLGQYKTHAMKFNEIPYECEYTGVSFADTNGICNPNDPLKRSIDHRVPIIEGFFKGWTVEQMNSRENLAWCIRYINTVKGNTTYESFSNLLPYIKEKINESIKNRTPYH